MSDLKMDDDGDLAIEGNTVPVVEGCEEVAQLLLQRLRTFLGEYFLDLSLGIPYVQEVFAKGVQDGILAGIFKSAILATPGVLDLVNFTLGRNGTTRALTLRFKALTSNGVIEVTETV